MSDEPTCAVCGNPATHTVDGVSEAEGNLVCEAHKYMWWDSKFTPIDDVRET